MAAREYDLIVIGAGAVGENVADYATKGGLTAVIVEAEQVSAPQLCATQGHPL